MNRRSYLPMWNIPNQAPICGTMTTSFLDVGAQGFWQAIADLLALVLTRLSQGDGPDVGHRQVLASLRPESLAEGLADRLRALPPCDVLNPSPEQLAARHDWLKQVAADQPGQAFHDVRDHARQLSEAKQVDLREAFWSAFRSRPIGCAALVDEVRSTVASLKIPAKTTMQLQRLGQLLTRLADLPDQQRQLTPQAFDQVRAALHKLANDASEAALTEVSLGRMTVILQQELLSRVERLVKELEQMAHQFQGRCAAMREAVESCGQQAAADEQAVSSTSILVPGATAEEVKAGLKSQLRVPDEESLVGKLADEFVGRLRAAAPAVCPHIDVAHAAPVDLLLNIDEKAATAEFVTLVREHQGAGQSLYQMIERRGLISLAATLVAKSGPTCFKQRLGEQFGLSPAEYALVELPLAANADDEQTRSRLEKELIRLCRGKCQPVVVAANLPVSLSQMRGGMVPGQHEGLPAMLQHYARSQHQMHLHRYIEDHDDVDAHPAYMRLVDDSGIEVIVDSIEPSDRLRPDSPNQEPYHDLESHE